MQLPNNVFEHFYEEETRFRDTVGEDIFRRLATDCNYYRMPDNALITEQAILNGEMTTLEGRGNCKLVANGTETAQTAAVEPAGAFMRKDNTFEVYNLRQADPNLQSYYGFLTGTYLIQAITGNSGSFPLDGKMLFTKPNDIPGDPLGQDRSWTPNGLAKV